MTWKGAGAARGPPRKSPQGPKIVGVEHSCLNLLIPDLRGDGLEMENSGEPQSCGLCPWSLPAGNAADWFLRGFLCLVPCFGQFQPGWACLPVEQGRSCPAVKP